MNIQFIEKSANAKIGAIPAAAGAASKAVNFLHSLQPDSCLEPEDIAEAA